MSEVLEALAGSDDPLERELARVLRIYQGVRASRGMNRSIGYEPRDIRKFGAIEVIERRVRNFSSGFDQGPAEHSYEAIVLQFPDRFQADLVELARQRLGAEEAEFAPTADTEILDQRVARLLQRERLPVPKGSKTAQTTVIAGTKFLRDPRVKAYVLQQAHGRCEACGTRAPFKSLLGFDYLEVHHVKPLAAGGSDRVQNAVAVCPNCHRALHHAVDATERASGLYRKIGRLIQE
ncbi:HNH endonuclease [Mesorhizobium sp. B3-2-1]|nr:HNH endonuclease [Mesorhizobium sp. B3-2-1]